VTVCNLADGYQSFGVTYRLHLQGGGDKLLRNVGDNLEGYTASQPVLDIFINIKISNLIRIYVVRI
jgi:hypothetical protein